MTYTKPAMSKTERELAEMWLMQCGWTKDETSRGPFVWREPAGGYYYTFSDALHRQMEADLPALIEAWNSLRARSAV